METVLITGGTGMIGQALTKLLLAKGYKVTIVSRSKKQSNNEHLTYVQWNVKEQTIDEKAIQQAHHIVHLAGAGVADKRWTEKRKAEIINSRVQSGETLVKALQQVPHNVRSLISASAIGWYGPDPVIPNPQPFTETAPSHSSFLGDTCRQWEAAIAPADAHTRLVIFRIGVAFSNEGGAYLEFKKPMRFGVAPVMGSGNQVISWIHVDDLVQLILFAIQNETIKGIYNAVAPQPVNNQTLVKLMAKKQPFALPFPVPALGLKIGLGELSIEVLKSATVSSEKIQAAGFVFQYSTVEQAVNNLK